MLQKVRFQLCYTFQAQLKFSILLCGNFKKLYTRLLKMIQIKYSLRTGIVIKVRFQICNVYFQWTKFYYTLWCEYNINKFRYWTAQEDMNTLSPLDGNWWKSVFNRVMRYFLQMNKMLLRYEVFIKIYRWYTGLHKKVKYGR